MTRLVLTGGFRVAFYLYLLLLAAHSLAQHRFAERHRRARDVRRSAAWPLLPSVDVWVPCYNEDPELLDACCRSLDAQDYQGALHILLVDDGSSNRAELRPVYQRCQGQDRRHRWTVVELAEHRGKRRAQDAALRRGDGELVMTVDSDTEVAPDGVSTMVAAFGDQGVAAVTGRLGVHNASRNRLTGVIEDLYGLLFDRERAAQAWFRSVLCCAGPFSVYRRAALKKCWNEYLGQEFLGRECNSGDDLHLTTLILGDGHFSQYERDATASTQVPQTVRHFALQQVRWWRSFYRELGWIGPAIRGRAWYVAFDVAARGLPPPLLAATLLLAAGESVLIGAGAGLRDLGLVATLVLTHGTFAAAQTGRWRYFCAGAVEALLVPLQFYALVTCMLSDWGRHEPRRELEDARLPAKTG